MRSPVNKRSLLDILRVFSRPILAWTFLRVAVGFFYKPWVIFSQRKSFNFFFDFFSHFLGPSKFFQDGFGKDFPYSAIREILTKSGQNRPEKTSMSSKNTKTFSKKIEFFPPAKYHTRLVEKHHGGARDAQTHMGAKENLSNCQSVKFFWRRIHMMYF